MKRKFVRAPLNSHALYVDEGYVLKAKTQNISAGGVLLSDLPHVPEINSIPMMFLMPLYPKFAHLSDEEIKNIAASKFPQKVLKVKARLVRSFEGESQVDKILKSSIGLEFYATTEEFDHYVLTYVETYVKNVVYLLSLFESLNKRPQNIEVMKAVAFLLGHDPQQKISLLRAKVLHDYQSLESP